MTEDEIRKTLWLRPTWTTAQTAFMLRVDRKTIVRWIDAGMPAKHTIDDHGQNVWQIRPQDAHDWNLDPTRRTRRK